MKGRKKSFDEETKDQVLSSLLSEDGRMSSKEIATKLGMDIEEVNLCIRHLRREGILPVSEKIVKPWSVEEKNFVWLNSRSNGGSMTSSSMAEKLGRKQRDVDQVLQIERRKKNILENHGSSSYRPRLWSEEDKEELRRLLPRVLRSELCVKFGVSMIDLRNEIFRLGLDDSRFHPLSIPFTEEEFRVIFRLSSCMSVKEISLFLGSRDEVSVRNAMYRMKSSGKWKELESEVYLPSQLFSPSSVCFPVMKTYRPVLYMDPAHIPAVLRRSASKSWLTAETQSIVDHHEEFDGEMSTADLAEVLGTDVSSVTSKVNFLSSKRPEKVKVKDEAYYARGGCPWSLGENLFVLRCLDSKENPLPDSLRMTKYKVSQILHRSTTSISVQILELRGSGELASMIEGVKDRKFRVPTEEELPVLGLHLPLWKNSEILEIADMVLNSSGGRMDYKSLDKKYRKCDGQSAELVAAIRKSPPTPKKVQAPVPDPSPALPVAQPTVTPTPAPSPSTPVVETKEGEVTESDCISFESSSVRGRRTLGPVLSAWVKSCVPPGLSKEEEQKFLEFGAKIAYHTQAFLKF